ncbi:copper amine oxidase N-terminal domain-containing protein [Pseudoflavonifractor sp. AF19-9AC]|uniref:copper amine oxidase N-terminal domain-containing protein n=1 Tax=Pseudoflavonifractor sp. AF19-9AC TaxID=2292244 RepID=UPI000E51FE9C|nr:copper amine oxidase N-terminal domain-containing protein [Pseudoflavonifractor sp. AF19-9AC]RHR06093.1 copper amine oxidase N-terminal domain-containing protein [Pseudoflavonifractor sp. AF19-9AC]
MQSHMHELWDELDLPEEYPQLEEQSILNRVNATLDAPAAPKKIGRKRLLKRSLLLAAALVLLTATAAAVSRAGVLELFFRGDTSQLEPYVQTALDTAENQDYRLTVGSCLYDGQNLYAQVTVEALNDRAAEDLMSNRVIAETHRAFWGEEMVNGLLESGSTGPCTFRSSLSQSGNLDTADRTGSTSSRELPNPTDHSRSWQIDIQFSSYLGPMEHPLRFWVGFMGEDCAVEIPLDDVVESIRLTPNAEVTCNPYTGYRGILREFILTPTSFSIDAELLEEPDESYYSSFLDTAEDSFFLRMKAGTILTRMQLGGINDQLDTVVDLSQVESIIYGDTEFPADGSAPFPAQLPDNLYPFTCTEIVPEGYGDFRFPVEELCRKLGADYRWDEETQTATATYRGVTLTMTVGEDYCQVNGEPVDLDYMVSSSRTVPQYIVLEDGVLTAPVTLLEYWSLDYPYLRDADGSPTGIMLVIP